jgi:DNA-binding transcriptional ArsR family regulator
MRNITCASVGAEFARLFGVTDGERYRTHDPRVLRAIAHPARVRILHELNATGPSRAADLAADLGIPANQASFHLRQLAKYGLVVEAPEEARDRRDRVWKVVSEEGIQLEISEMDQMPGGPAAVDVWSENSRRYSHAVVDAVYVKARQKDAFGHLSQGALRLTKEEARQLSDELAEVTRRWSSKTRGRDPRRKTYMLMEILQLYPDLAPPDEK